MYLEQSVKLENKFWKYVVGTFIIVLAHIMGQIPLIAAIFIKTNSEGKQFPSDQSVMMTMLDSNLTLFLLLFSFVTALFALYFVVKYFHKQSFLEFTTSRKKMDWNRVFFSFFLWSGFIIISTLIDYYSNPENFVSNFHFVPFVILFVIAIVMIPIQTSCEEYVFRGYLMQGFANFFKNKWVPLITTSFIFGLLHLANPEVDKLGNTILIYYIGTGFLLGIMTLMDDGMELSLGFHAANNVVGALVVTADWTVFQTNSVLKDLSEPGLIFDVIMPVIVIYPILLFIFAKKYKWSNWKEKLTGKIE